MTSTAATQTRQSHQAQAHAHLWLLPDGTGLHAPYGRLVFDSGTGRVCCHLCGRWFVSLGGHLRRHGHNAESYRDLIGLCRSRPLVAETLSRSIAARQRRAYRRSPALRAQLAAGQELSKTGRLTALAATAHTASPSPELTRLRSAALEAGRATRAAERNRALGQHLGALGFGDLVGYLRHACSAGVSLRGMARATGLGWARLRREIDAVGVLRAATELHHSKHHATYVKGANTALEQLAQARENDALGTVNMLEKNLAFNLGGHVNHSVFWPNMSPDGGDKPDGELAAAIDQHFGSFDAFRKHFTANSLGVQGGSTPSTCNTATSSRTTSRPGGMW